MVGGHFRYSAGLSFYRCVVSSPGLNTSRKTSCTRSSAWPRLSISDGNTTPSCNTQFRVEMSACTVRDLVPVWHVVKWRKVCRWCGRIGSRLAIVRRQGLATLSARQGLPNRSRKPFCENYFRSLKGSSLRCRYGRCPYRSYVLPMHVQGRARQPRGYSNHGLVRRPWRTTSFEPQAFHPQSPPEFSRSPSLEHQGRAADSSNWKREADVGPLRQRRWMFGNPARGKERVRLNPKQERLLDEMETCTCSAHL